MIKIGDTIKDANDTDRVVSKIYSVVINTDVGQIIFSIDNKDSISVSTHQEINDLLSIPIKKTFQIDGSYGNMIIIN